MLIYLGYNIFLYAHSAHGCVTFLNSNYTHSTSWTHTEINALNVNVAFWGNYQTSDLVGLIEIERERAVSYTHLDVYKRQPMRLASYSLLDQIKITVSPAMLKSINFAVDRSYIT